MGQHPAKQSAREQEVERLEELDVLIRQAFQTADALRGPAFDEKARGIPSTPGSKQAQYEAAHKYWRMLLYEQRAIFHRWTAEAQAELQRRAALRYPSIFQVLQQQGAEPASLSSGHAGDVDPGTLTTCSTSNRGQRGGNSSGSCGGGDAAVAGDTERLESAPLLGGGGSQLAAGLRQRQGHARVGGVVAD